MNAGFKTLSVIVPVYYNEPALAELFGELQTFEAELLHRRVLLELIFVNDGSGDNSLAEVLKIRTQRPTTKAISFVRNFGAVAASKAGFRAATGDAFIVLAADLQDPVSQVLIMVDHWLRGSSFVIAVRDEREDPIVSKIFSYLYYKIVRLLVVKDFPKGGFDLMLASSALLPYINQQGRNVNPNVFCYQLGFRPTIVTYKRLKRKHGKSRWTFGKKLHHLVNTVTGSSVVPIRMISFLGLFVALISFVYATDILVSAIIGDVPVRGFASLGTLIAFFSGVILTVLGLIGEYLWRIFDAVHHKPESVIEERWL